MLAYRNLAARNAYWSAFSADPDKSATLAPPRRRLLPWFPSWIDQQRPAVACSGLEVLGQEGFRLAIERQAVLTGPFVQIVAFAGDLNKAGFVPG